MPWIFAYMSDATDLFMQRVSGHEELVKRLQDKVKEAEMNVESRLIGCPQPGGKPAWVDAKASFIRHRINKNLRILWAPILHKKLGSMLVFRLFTLSFLASGLSKLDQHCSRGLLDQQQFAFLGQKIERNIFVKTHISFAVTN